MPITIPLNYNTTTFAYGTLASSLFPLYFPFSLHFLFSLSLLCYVLCSAPRFPTSGEVVQSFRAFCVPISWFRECWKTEGFTTPCSHVQTWPRPLCVERSTEAGVMRAVPSVDLGERCPVSCPGLSTRKGEARDEGGVASLGGRQGWPCSEFSTQKPGRAAVSERAQCEGPGASYSSLWGPKPHSQHSGSQRPHPRELWPNPGVTCV